MNIIIGNIFSFIGGLIDFIFNIKFNEKPKILKSNCFSSSCSLISYIFLEAYDGIVDCLVTLIRLITIYLKDKYNKKCNFLFVIFIGLYSLVFLDYSGIQTIILFISSMFAFVPKWIFKNMQIIRLGGLIACIFAIIYNFLISNYAIITIQIISALLTLVALIKWSREKKKVK